MKKKKQLERKQTGVLFVPAGVILGLGFGLLFDNAAAGLFIGLGAGFACWAIAMLFVK